MEECIRDSMKKLALWDTKTFKPITTHEELEPIMVTLGFVVVRPSSPAVNDGASWREYAYLARGRRKKPDGAEEPAPRSNPKLPYPKIDGLHVYMYKAFLDAVNFYLKMSDISDLFHIRGMPLHKIHDKNKKWRRMEECGESVSTFVYRDGTLDQEVYNFYHSDKQSSNGNHHNLIHDKGSDTPTSCIVSLKDIIE